MNGLNVHSRGCPAYLYNCCDLLLAFVRNNRSLICVIDELLDLIRVKDTRQSLDLRQGFISFLNCDDINILLNRVAVRGLYRKRVLLNRETCLHCIIAVDNRVSNIRKLLGNLCRFDLDNL